MRLRFLRVLLLSLLVIPASCNNKDTIVSNGKQPIISSFEPAQVSRGSQNVEGHILGANFAGAIAVNLGPGITVNSISLRSSTEVVVQFSVRADAQTGTQTIAVMTPDGLASSSSVLSINDNRGPTARFTVNPTTGGVGSTFSFDASLSRDPDGPIQAYDWDFGDSQTGSGKQVTHQYSAAGTFNVTLKVTDRNQATATAEASVQVTNTRPPVAHFNVTPTKGDATTNFRFDGTSSTDADGRIVQWAWDFGDGTTSGGKVVNHKYPRSDTFSVSLTVTDNSGLQGSVNKSVEVRGLPPIAEFTVTPDSGDTSTTFHFDASASSDPDGSIVSFVWKFGGGSTYEGRHFTRQFPENGTYTVTLTVTDNDGMTDTSRSKSIDVGSGGGPPPPPPQSDPCTINNFDGQAFKVVDVSGRVITANVDFITCANKCPEIRRDVTGICEFVGDASNIHGNQTTFNPGSLPPACLPVPGEILRMIWKHCG